MRGRGAGALAVYKDINRQTLLALVLDQREHCGADVAPAEEREQARQRVVGKGQWLVRGGGERLWAVFAPVEPQSVSVVAGDNGHKVQVRAAGAAGRRRGSAEGELVVRPRDPVALLDPKAAQGRIWCFLELLQCRRAAAGRRVAQDVQDCESAARIVDCLPDKDCMWGGERPQIGEILG